MSFVLTSEIAATSSLKLVSVLADFAISNAIFALAIADDISAYICSPLLPNADYNQTAPMNLPRSAANVNAVWLIILLDLLF
jgi:hypothetical protein